MTNKHIILFDGVCSLCNGWVQFLKRYDKKTIFTYISLQSEHGLELVNTLKINTKIIDSIIYIKADQYYIESRAIVEIINDLNGLWKLLLVFNLLPKRIKDFIYRKIAQNRHLIFKNKFTCVHSTLDIKS